MTEEDRIAYEAFGALQHFAETNPACPQYLRDMVKDYQRRKAECRAAYDLAHRALQQPAQLQVSWPPDSSSPDYSTEQPGSESIDFRYEDDNGRKTGWLDGIKFVPEDHSAPSAQPATREWVRLDNEHRPPPWVPVLATKRGKMWIDCDCEKPPTQIFASHWMPLPEPPHE